MESQRFIVTCKGACEPNPGRGAWAFRRRTFDGKEPHDASGSIGGISTNQRAELTGILMGLLATPMFSHITLFSDMRNVVEKINRIAPGEGYFVNADLWVKIGAAVLDRDVDATWIKKCSTEDHSACCKEAFAIATGKSVGP